MGLLDAYERKARLTPGLFAVLPVACTFTTLGLEKFPLVAAIAGLLSAAGGAFLISNIVGDLGRAAQDRLFESWGVSPTTKALRLRDPSNNPIQRDRWRAAVTSVTGIDLLSADQEEADPEGADHRIIAAYDQLRFLGQKGGQPAVVAENAAYGYQRNMYGVRHVGRYIAAVCIIVQIAAIVGPWPVSSSACIVGAVVSTGFLTLWILIPSQNRTRLAAERYAHQLFIAAHTQSRQRS